MKIVLLFLALALSVTAGADERGDAAFLQARDAFRAGDAKKLERALGNLEGHELRLYPESWQLRMAMDQEQDAAIENWLETHAHTYAAEKLRGDWIKWLARKQRWREVEKEALRLKVAEQDLACLALQARWERRDAQALDDALPLWLSLPDPPETCVPVLNALVAEQRVSTDDLWARVRRQFEANRARQAKATLNWLPAGQAPAEKTIDALIASPMRHLAQQSGPWAASRTGRELAVLAIARVAANDPRMAAEQLEQRGERLKDGERQWAWGQIGWQAAKRHMAEALSWYARAGRAPLSDEVLQWWVRAALRAQDWGSVHQVIQQMPAELARQSEWVYWLGRSLKAGGRLSDAEAAFSRIAGQPHFYGNLAAEELGRKVAPPPAARPVQADELTAARENPGLRRALAFFRLDLRYEAVREWNYSLRGMNDRQLLAAAELARQQSIWDRAINTAERTQEEHDYGLRFLAPYGEQVRPAARNQALDDAWVYGLMRQESRFVTRAKSSVGASGLMQLMPATAKWVAKKVGLKDYHHGQVNDTETNVLLGTTYMRMVMESLDQHPVLASAAYNAGPGRARKWRAEQAMEGAIYAETIPFNETRDYVKKVMSNASYYASIFYGQPDSLKTRLGVIGPRGNETGAGADLP